MVTGFFAEVSECTFIWEFPKKNGCCRNAKACTTHTHEQTNMHIYTQTNKWTKKQTKQTNTHVHIHTHANKQIEIPIQISRNKQNKHVHRHKQINRNKQTHVHKQKQTLRNCISFIVVKCWILVGITFMSLQLNMSEMLLISSTNWDYHSIIFQFSWRQNSGVYVTLNNTLADRGIIEVSLA